MSKKLGIKGHSTYGKEIIEILEMLGGRNSHERTGNNDKTIYYIDDRNNINCDWTLWNNNRYTILTLEEFLEKYPFKVGDKVVYTKFGDNCDDYPIIIKSMKWTGTTIEYAFDGYVTCLAKDLKMWNGEPDTVISGIYLNRCDYADEVELNLGDYEIEVRDGKTYAVKKKPKYPTTYDECCNILGVTVENLSKFIFKDFHLTVTHTFSDSTEYYINLFKNFFKLKICYDAYRKIAGEQMGLGKPWEPDWSTSTPKYIIACTCNGIEKQWETTYCKILSFPTTEMRDAFFENFKDLIESCKELL